MIEPGLFISQYHAKIPTACRPGFSPTCQPTQRVQKPLRVETRPTSNRLSGFTLIEVLVVLIIVAMVSSVLFEALERAYRLEDRFGTELFKVQQGQMAVDWYRQSVQGLYPDYSNGQNIFQGKESEFSGLSGNPLGENYGAPTPITWKIRNNRHNGTAELVYIEEKREAVLLAWHGSQAKFVYFDAHHNPNDSWPPPLGLSTQLPGQIQLMAKDTGDTINIVASPRVHPDPLPRPQDILGITTPQGVMGTTPPQGFIP